MEETAYAKINLALHVRGQESDGYHRIETLFAFAEDGDRLRVEQGDGLTLRIEGPFAEGLSVGPDNLVRCAAEALRTRYGVTAGAALTLDKRLPVASGIGGGSADAAATLRLLARWWELDPGEEALIEIGADLGADVPACVLSRTVRGDGRGDRLHPVAKLATAALPALLVNPCVPVSTAAVFKRWDGLDQGPLSDDWLGGRNDLEGPAIVLAPEIGAVLALLREQGGVRLVRMSGSGATCFALFDSESARDAADRAIAARRPGWWRLASRLR